MLRSSLSPVGSPTPSVDIKLTQHPNQFFFPGSTVSGQAIYESGDENEDFELYITFTGVNKSMINTSRKHSGHMRRDSDEATLFQYKHPLHSGLRRQGLGNVGMSKYPFNFRFPSNTDNRSFVQPRGSVVSQTWSSSVHELPPSFDLEHSRFTCSVEYVLRLELFHDKTLSASMELPIVFLPYRANNHPLRPSSISMPGLMHLTDSDSSNVRRDSVIEVRDDVNFKFVIEAPQDIIVGRSFRLEAVLEFNVPSIFDDDDLLDPTVQIETLKIICTTSCRAFRHAARSPSSHEYEEQDFEQRSRVLLPYSVLPSSRTNSNELRFSFEATLPSSFSPTFRSFLVSNSYHLQATFVAYVDGKAVKLTLDAPDIPVLSPVAPSLGPRRLAAPMVPSTRQSNLGFGRALACQI